MRAKKHSSKKKRRKSHAIQKKGRAGDLAARYGWNEATVWRYVAKKILPPPKRVTPGLTIFDFDECDAALEAEAARQAQPKFHPKSLRRASTTPAE